MTRANRTTILLVTISAVIAGALIWLVVADPDRSRKGKAADDEPFELVTELEEPVPVPLAPVPEGPKLDLTAILHDHAGKEVPLSELVTDRTLVVLLDPDTGDRRAKDATRNLNRLLAGGEELHFRVVAVLPRGIPSSEVAEFARKRRLEIPIYVDANGDLEYLNEWELRSAALIDGEGTIIRSFEPSWEWDERFGLLPPLSDDILFFAWAIPEEGPPLSDETKEAAVALVRAALTAPVDGEGVPPSLARRAADPALAEEPEHAVFVSLFRPGQTSSLRGRADEGTLGERLVIATGRALHSARDREEWVADAAQIRTQIDVLGPSFPVPGRELRTLWYFIEPGVDGVLVPNGDREGIVLPAEAVTEGILSPRVRKRDEKLPRLLAEACRRAGVASRAWKNPDIELRRFRTTCFGEVVPGEGTRDLYRANVLYGDQSTEELVEAIDLGGEWLLGAVQQDGSFDYQYYPNTDRGSSDYSVVRHAGSVYGLFEMAELAHDEPALADDEQAYQHAGALAVGWVYRSLEPIPEDEHGDRYCLIVDDRCDSGSAALSLMTYLSRPPREHIHDPEDLAAIYRPDDQQKMDGLALAMLDMIDDDGKVFKTYREASREDRVEKEPLYYPGEVMLALARYHAVTGDERWLEGAERIAAHRIDRYRENRWRNPDHWVMQGLYVLFRETGHVEYAERALQMGMHHASEQFGGPREPPFPDYRGAYRRSKDVPRTTRAASRTEAMMGVVRTAWAMGIDARVYEDAVLAASRHMGEQLFRPENSYWMADPDRALGALRMGLVDNHCRIDNNQHALVGMAGALEVARKRASLEEAIESAER